MNKQLPPSKTMLDRDLKKIPTMDRFAKHTKYYERQQRMLDAHATRSALITHRKNIIESQNRLNYQNEFNRVLGELSVNGHRGETAESRRRKRDRLRDLHATGHASTEAATRLTERPDTNRRYV